MRNIELSLQDNQSVYIYRTLKMQGDWTISLACYLANIVANALAKQEDINITKLTHACLIFGPMHGKLDENIRLV